MFERLNSILSKILQRRSTASSPPVSIPDAIHVAVERHPVCLADLSREDLRNTITRFNDRADTVGCLIFNGEERSERAVVIFAGNLERFHMLAAARHLRCRVIYVQDVQSWWYQGSALLPNLHDFCQLFLTKELGAAPTLLFGQSSGAYAALVASTYLRGSTVVACAPQTFSDSLVKTKIHFVGINPHFTPANLIDLRSQIEARPDPEGSKTVVIAASELGNPASAHFWMDYLHALRLADLPDVALSIVNADSHVIAHGRIDLFAELLGQLSIELTAPAPRRNEITREFLNRAFALPDANSTLPIGG